MDVTAGRDGYSAGRDVNIDNRQVAPLPHPSQVDVPGPVFWTPRPAVRVFEGRSAALSVLESALDARGEAVVTQAIYGLGGVGKSELALQYASKHRADYRLTWWITAVDPGQIEAGLASMAARLCPVPTTGTTSDAAKWAIGWLQAHHRWLLILDNVEDPAQVEPLLGQLGTGHVIVTTRIDADWSRIADPLRLDILDPAAGVDLLAARTRRHAPEDLTAFARIAEELGYLPLALDQAAAYMTAQRVPPAGYAERLRQHPSRMYATGSGGDAQRTIARVWDLHIAAIDAASPTGADLLNALAWYAPDAIPRVMLGGDAPHDETDEALALLARYSLITLTDDAVTVHRLLQAVILSRAQATSRDTALDWLAHALPDEPDRNVAQWPLLRSLVPHAEALSCRFSKIERPQELSFVQGVVGQFLQVQGDYPRALAMRQSALDICQAELGPDDPDTAVCLSDLAVTYLALGRAQDALPLAERAFRIVESAQGANHPAMAVRLGILGLTYRALGRAEEALLFEERGLRIAEAVLGPDHLGTSVRLANLAVTYLALGRAQDALPLVEHALRIAEAVLGPDHPDTALLLGNLATTYRGLGRAGDALPLAERALRMTEAALGPDHPDMAFRLDGLAFTFRALGREADAIPLEERAAEIRRRIQQ